MSFLQYDSFVVKKYPILRKAIPDTTIRLLSIVCDQFYTANSKKSNLINQKLQKKPQIKFIAILIFKSKLYSSIIISNRIRHRRISSMHFNDFPFNSNLSSEKNCNPESAFSERLLKNSSIECLSMLCASHNQIELERYSPFLEQNEQNSCNGKTDRYIPSRKLLRKESLRLGEEPITDENAPPQLFDPCACSISEIYRKCIMLKPKESIKSGSLIEEYQNHNLFKYSSQTVSQNLAQNKLFTSQLKTLDFTEELVKNIKSKRKINKLPFKVLDAPALQDDFYLNLIDWSNQNILAVGLGSNVYLWNGDNSKVTKLCDLGLSDTVTSVGWTIKDPVFTIGTNNGEVHIWDINKSKRTRVMHGHSNRVSSISWNSTILSTGSRDKTILHRDIRCSSPFISKLTGHKQEVCGLKWSPDEQQLCSGGNDNKLFIWNQHSNSPVLKYADHIAAVKAVAWSPHQHGLLASGGGTADKNIKFRNTLTGTTINSIDTGSQVCNLIFSKTMNEVVSTHGYSFNQINIWKYPKMQKISTLTGHTMRVLYLTMSPDGSTIVTGAGDETLRFWSVFPNRNEASQKVKTLLSNNTVSLR